MSGMTMSQKILAKHAGLDYVEAGQLIEALNKCNGDLGGVLGDWDQDTGAWIRFNALDGEGVRNENVTSFRFALVESDAMPVDEQIAGPVFRPVARTNDGCILGQAGVVVRDFRILLHHQRGILEHHAPCAAPGTDDVREAARYAHVLRAIEKDLAEAEEEIKETIN